MSGPLDPLNVPDHARTKPGDPSIELHIRGHRFILTPGGQMVFGFDHGAGMILRNGNPKTNDLMVFAGGRAFGWDGDVVVMVVVGPDAALITKTLKEART